MTETEDAAALQVRQFSDAPCDNPSLSEEQDPTDESNTVDLSKVPVPITEENRAFSILWSLYPFACRKRSEHEQPVWVKRMRIMVQYLLLVFVMFIITVWVGAEIEDYHIRKASDTSKFYEGNQVCVIPNASEPLEVISVANKTLAGDDASIAHCGDCGSCSNQHDINIYDETKNTLLDTTITCAKRSFIWGRKTSGKCMKDNVGFTPECNDCWVENIMCDLRKCVFTCVWYGLFQVKVDTGDTKKLNPCTTCDEVRCGPEFVTCAGVNRRRAGILSDIDRDFNTEVCADVTPDWWKDPQFASP